MRLDKQEVSAQKPCHIEQGASAQQHFKQQVSSPNFTKPVTHEHRGSAQQPCKQQVSIRTSHHLIAKTYQITHTHTHTQAGICTATLQAAGVDFNFPRFIGENAQNDLLTSKGFSISTLRMACANYHLTLLIHGNEVWRYPARKRPSKGFATCWCSMRFSIRVEWARALARAPAGGAKLFPLEEIVGSALTRMSFSVLAEIWECLWIEWKHEPLEVPQSVCSHVEAHNVGKMCALEAARNNGPRIYQRSEASW